MIISACGALSCPVCGIYPSGSGVFSAPSQWKWLRNALAKYLLREEEENLCWSHPEYKIITVLSDLKNKTSYLR